MMPGWVIAAEYALRMAGFVLFLCGLAACVVGAFGWLVYRALLWLIAGEEPWRDNRI